MPLSASRIPRVPLQNIHDVVCSPCRSTRAAGLRGGLGLLICDISKTYRHFYENAGRVDVCGQYSHPGGHPPGLHRTGGRRGMTQVILRNPRIPAFRHPPGGLIGSALRGAE